jgi:hypothetical protein
MPKPIDKQPLLKGHRLDKAVLLNLEPNKGPVVALQAAKVTVFLTVRH